MLPYAIQPFGEIVTFDDEMVLQSVEVPVDDAAGTLAFERALMDDARLLPFEEGTGVQPLEGVLTDSGGVLPF